MPKRKKEENIDPKDALVIAYQKHLGNMRKACAEIGVNRTTVYNWISTLPDFAARIADIEEEMLDDVEESLRGSIKQGFKTVKRTTIINKDAKGNIIGSTQKVEETQQSPDPIAMMRFLERKGAHRGWAKDNPFPNSSDVSFSDE